MTLLSELVRRSALRGRAAGETEIGGGGSGFAHLTEDFDNGYLHSDLGLSLGTWDSESGSADPSEPHVELHPFNGIKLGDGTGTGTRFQVNSDGSMYWNEGDVRFGRLNVPGEDETDAFVFTALHGPPNLYLAKSEQAAINYWNGVPDTGEPFEKLVELSSQLVGLQRDENGEAWVQGFVLQSSGALLLGGNQGGIQVRQSGITHEVHVGAAAVTLINPEIPSALTLETAGGGKINWGDGLVAPTLVLQPDFVNGVLRCSPGEFVVGDPDAGHVWIATTTIESTGGIEILGAGEGLRLKSPDGLTQKTITINNAGAIALV